MWPLSLHTGIFGTKTSTTRENERQQSIGIGILRGFQKGSHCFIKSDTIAFHLHFHTEERDTEKKKKNTPHFCTLLLSFSFSPRVVCSTFSSSWWNSSHARRSSMARYKIAPSSGRSKRHMKWRYTSKIDSKLQDCPTFSWTRPVAQSHRNGKPMIFVRICTVDVPGNKPVICPPALNLFFPASASRLPRFYDLVLRLYKCFQILS